LNNPVLNIALCWVISCHLSLIRFVFNGLLAGYNAEYQNSCYLSGQFSGTVKEEEGTSYVLWRV